MSNEFAAILAAPRDKQAQLFETELENLDWPEYIQAEGYVDDQSVDVQEVDVDDETLQAAVRVDYSTEVSPFCAECVISEPDTAFFRAVLHRSTGHFECHKIDFDDYEIDNGE